MSQRQLRWEAEAMHTGLRYSPIQKDIRLHVGDDELSLGKPQPHKSSHRAILQSPWIRLSHTETTLGQSSLPVQDIKREFSNGVYQEGPDEVQEGGSSTIRAGAAYPPQFLSCFFFFFDCCCHRLELLVMSFSLQHRQSLCGPGTSQ